MFSSTSQMVIILLLLWFLCVSTTNSLLGQGSLNQVRCNEKDKHLLSVFKQGIDDPLKRLSSWSTEEDCCKWFGVQCDNTTGRVTKLDLHCLSSSCLGGEINFSLFDLEFLSYLDLRSNNFKAIHFPPVHDYANDQTSHNTSLKTSSSPSNFSNLLHLDLSFNSLYMENLRWVSRAPSLKYLNLNFVTINRETPWLQQLTMLPSLVVLGLRGCFLDGTSPSLGYVNFTSSLAVLDISLNFFDSFSKWLFNLSSSVSYMDLTANNLRGQIPATMVHFQHLEILRLGINHLNGSIPEWIGQYNHLKHLCLYGNLLSGPIPAAVGSLSSLTFLDAGYNQLNGSLPRDLGKLSSLKYLSVDGNPLSGNLSEQSFAKLSKLKHLSIDGTAFIFQFGTHWQPPFQLEEVHMGNCKLGPEFPSWLYTQRSLSHLDISGSGLSFTAHEEFWRFVAQIEFVNLCNNSISGDISFLLINNTAINLKANNLRGKLPRLSPEVHFFSVADNSLSGPISPILCHSWIGNSNLALLDLSNNLLFGEFPDCWMHWKSLRHLNLGRNNLTGKIPDSIGSLIELETLRLHKNSLSGNIPTSLKSCKQLWFLDLQFNELTGNIPSWISQLSMALMLRSNQLNGSIPLHVCQLSNLLVLDLANNRLSGPIPKCLYNITRMVTDTTIDDLISPYLDWRIDLFPESNYLEDLSSFVKGQELDYKANFMLLHIVDLSNNDLLGLIPQELFSLSALQYLNLSHNHLHGVIPRDIGHMRFLESLDLSSNLLTGEIPQSMSNLSFLNHLNLSYNNFKERIPLGTQLQSFDAFSYIGNPELCGAPLSNNCTQEEKHNGSKWMEDKESDFRSSFNIGMGVGFAIGFWGVCGTIFFVRRWRHAYFRILDKFYVFIIIKMNRFL